MADQTMPNGVPPQMKQHPMQDKPQYQFNGVNSTHSSRDPSPAHRLGGIPSSQLPPGKVNIPSSQLPPSRSPITTVTKNLAQLNVGNQTATPNVAAKFNTSTPNQQVNVQNFGQDTPFSPISSTAVSNHNGRTIPPVLENVPLNSEPINRVTNSNQTKPEVNPLLNRNPVPLVSQQNSIVFSQQVQHSQSDALFNSKPVVSTSSQPVLQQFQPPVQRQNPPNQRQQFQQFPTVPQVSAPKPVSSQSYNVQNFNLNPSQSRTTQPQTSQNYMYPQPNQPMYNNAGIPPMNATPPPTQQLPQKTLLHAKRYPTSMAPSQNYNQQPPMPSMAPQSYQYPQQQQKQYPSMLQQNSFPPSQQPQVQQNVYQSHQQVPNEYTRPSVVDSGFNKFFGRDSIDLLQQPNVLPPHKIEPPKINLGAEQMNSVNVSPDIIRCTVTKIPENNSLLQKARLPLGVLIHPFRDITNLQVITCNVIVRCRTCRTYINPFVYFVDNKRWKCNLCYRINELPEEFQYDPASKTYGDPSRRPEIKTSTIEYIAPAEYMLRPPQPAVYLFLLDISRLALESGYLTSVCNILLEELQYLPGDARTQVGFIAYDSALHFFSLAEGLSQPHEMTVLDIDDVFLPCPDNLLVNLKDRYELVCDLLGQLPTRFNNSYDNNSALGAALQAGYKLMGATGGRITVFQCSLPNVGPGALTAREDPSQRATTEVSHLNPANDFYKRLALECSGQQIAVDMFILNSQYVDIATISGISRFSGGCIHHYPLFKASKTLQCEGFENCFKRYLTRKIGFEAVMRIRCTRGLAVHTFHGNFFVRSTDLLSLPNTNPDAAYGMQVSIEESLSDVQSVCFQAALLYTSYRGERRIRVHTVCVPVASTLQDIIHSADQQCIVGLLAKMAVDRSMQSSLSDAREAFINVAIDILSSYKMSLNMGNGQNDLLAPSCLKLLPLYISALLKNTAFRTGTTTRVDDRVKAMIDMKCKPLYLLIQQIYPDLYPVHNLEAQETNEEGFPMPPRLQLSARCLDNNGAFLMDTGEHMILLVCPNVSPIFLRDCLGILDYRSIDQMFELNVLNNPNNERLHKFITYLNDQKPFPATLEIMRDNSPNRVTFFEKLVEDRMENALSYHEFLQHLKSQVK